MYNKKKQFAFDDLKEILQKQLLVDWNELEIEKMRNDMFILFEASYSCYKVINVTKGETHPFFITNNMQLIQGFVYDFRKEISDIINKYGFEYFIKPILISDFKE